MIALAAALGACSTARTTPEWLEQREPGGPCYEANLLDGLSEESTDELHAVFDCLNRQDAFEPFSGVVDSLDTEARDGDPAGVELARATNQAGDADIDVFGVATVLLDAARSGELTYWSEVVVEVLYGTSYERVESEVDLRAGSSLDRGLVRPLLPALRFSAEAIVDNDLEPTTVLGEALVSEHVASATERFAELAEAGLFDDVPADLGDAIERSRSTDNDRWDEASGDSIRDISEKLFLETGNDGRIAIEHIADPARVVLADDQVRDGLRQTLIELDDGGHLRALPPQLVYLAEVDPDGAALEAGEDSALVALLRLLQRGNGPMECSLDLWVASLDVKIDNFSVEFLSRLAQQDPGAVESGVSILGDLLGWPFSREILYAIADSGLCNPLDRQMVDDVQAIDRFNDPATSDLLRALLWTLEDFYAVDDSKIPELVDLLATVRNFDTDRPLEELLRDIGTSALVYDFVDVLAELRADFDPLWDAAEAAFAIRSSGRSGVEELSPTIQAAFVQEGTWTTLGNTATLLQRGDARSTELLARLPGLLQEDLPLLTGLGEALQDEGLVRPILLVVETEEVHTAMAQAEITVEGPLPFLARLVVGGTLTEALALLEWGLDLLEGEEER